MSQASKQIHHLNYNPTNNQYIQVSNRANQTPNKIVSEARSKSHHDNPEVSNIKQRIQKENSIIMYEWQAVYIDSKFYLSNKIELEKLQELQSQIKFQRKKLQMVQESCSQYNKSFHSARQVHQKEKSLRSEIINANNLQIRKEKAEKDLFEEESKYREKIKQIRNNRKVIKRQSKEGNIYLTPEIQFNKSNLQKHQSNDKNTQVKQQNLRSSQQLNKQGSKDILKNVQKIQVLSKHQQNNSQLNKQQKKSETLKPSFQIKKSFQQKQQTNKKSSSKRQEIISKLESKNQNLQKKQKSIYQQICEKSLKNNEEKTSQKFKNQSAQWSERPDYQSAINIQQQNKVKYLVKPINKSSKNCNIKLPHQNAKEEDKCKSSFKVQIEHAQRQSISLSHQNFQKIQKTLSHNKKFDNHQQPIKQQKNFLIHYSKSSQKKSISKNKNESQKNERQKQLSQVKCNDEITKNKLNEKNEHLINEEMFKKSSRKSEADMVPFSQVCKLRLEMEELKKQVKLIVEYQPQLSNYTGVNNSKIETEKMRNEQQGDIFESPKKGQAKILPKIGNLSRKELNLQSSIIQFNFLQEKQKNDSILQEKNQKIRLTDQIQRLKKVIRELRIQKIKANQQYMGMSYISLGRKESEDYLSHQRGETSHFIEKIIQPHIKPVQELSTSKISSFQIGKFGKIIKNSPEKTIQSEFKQIPFSLVQKNQIPQTKSQHRYTVNQTDPFNQPLPKRTSNPSIISKNQSQFTPQKTNVEALLRVKAEQKQFNEFIQQKQEKYPKQQTIKKNNQNDKVSANQTRQQSRQNINSFNIPKLNRSVSRQSLSYRKNEFVRQMQNKQITEEAYDEPKQLKPIKFETNHIEIPNLPINPTNQMGQQELINLAKGAFKTLLNIDFNDTSLSESRQGLFVKKFKNCILCSTPSSSECILWDFSGKFYFGGWKKIPNSEGQKSGQGLEYVPGKYIYKGQFQKGKKNGSGYIQMHNGDIYEGQWTDGFKNGQGKYLQLKTGISYVGQWKNNRKDGQGLLRFSQKEYYEGTFVQSLKHGYGIEFFGNCDSYRGQYNRGKFNGKGVYCWANGSSYEGNFIQGLRSGQGKWKSAERNGDIYVGQYLNDKKKGYGRYVWINGSVYEGYFQNDMKHGKGRLIYEDAKQVKGRWQYGNLVQTENGKKPFENQQQPLRKSVRYSSFIIQSNSRIYESKKITPKNVNN